MAMSLFTIVHHLVKKNPLVNPLAACGHSQSVGGGGASAG